MNSNLSILITTLNEERNLQALVRHLGETYPVVVVDSGSTDGGPAIVDGTENWTLYRHPYLSQGEQLNWSLANVIETEWVFILDADERLAGGVMQLEGVLASLKASGRSVAAFKRQNYFGARRLKFGGFYPDWQVRLMRRSARYEVRPVHSHVQVEPHDIHFAEPELLHQTYTDVEQYIRKLGSYVVSEALSEPMPSSRPRGRLLRTISEKMPLPGTSRFLYSYLVQQGFRDGKLGFYLALWAGYRANIKRGRRYMSTIGQLNGSSSDFQRDESW